MKVRTPEIRDARSIAEIHVQSWRSAYRGIMPQRLLDNLDVGEREEMWQRILESQCRQNLVLELESRIIGWSAFGKARDEDLNPNKVAELYGIYLLQEYWGNGYGSELWQSSLNSIIETDAQSVVLWVLKENRRAVRFYSRHGFSLERGKSKDLLRDGVALPHQRLMLRL
ncbi:MAG: GNAT family N-acetyltransferase [Verrucomicrobiota bacterium]